MFLVNDTLLMQTTLAALLVIGGVVAKNSSEQLSMSGPLEYAGMAMFICGWILSAYVLSQGKSLKLWYIIPCMGVLVSVMMMKEMKNLKLPSYVLPSIFILSWVMIGFNAGDKFSGMIKYSGLLSSALVIGSMMKVLPFQRTTGNVDGPGSYMFMFAWAIIVMLNSTM